MLAAEVVKVELKLSLIGVKEEFVQAVTKFLGIVLPERVEIDELCKKHLLRLGELVLLGIYLPIFDDSLVLS